jgi:hypothetical protein
MHVFGIISSCESKQGTVLDSVTSYNGEGLADESCFAQMRVRSIHMQGASWHQLA